MLDLYHAEPTGASARVLIVLEEKALKFRSHYVDMLAREQYRSPLAQIAPGGHIPVLVRDGVASTGPSALCELLDEAYPECPLMPRDARDRWCVRAWQKHVDDMLAPAVSTLAWQAYGERSLEAQARAELESVEHLARARARIEETALKVEAALATGEWLAGPKYSLADVAVFAYFKYLPALGTDCLTEAQAPRTLAWLCTMSERPAVCATLAHGRAADPFRTAIPGPEWIRWG